MVETDKDKNDKEEKDFNDMYDIVAAIIKVYSQHETLNTDYVLADLRPELYENVAIVYITTQLNIMVAINNYLDKEDESEKKWKIKIQKLMLDETTSMVVMSRAGGGLLIRALLDYVKGTALGGTQIPNSTQTEPNIITKGANMLGLGKKKEGEKK